MSQRQPQSVGQDERRHQHPQKDDYSSTTPKQYVIQEQSMPFDDEPPYDQPDDENAAVQNPTMTSFPKEDPMTSYPGTQAEVTLYPGTRAEVTSYPGARAEVTSYPGTQAEMTSQSSYPVGHRGMTSHPGAYQALPSLLTYSEVTHVRPVFYTDDHVARPSPYVTHARRNTARKLSTFSSSPLCVRIPSETQSVRYIGTPSSRYGAAPTPIQAPGGYYPYPNATMVKAFPVTQQKKEQENGVVCCSCPCLTVLILGISFLMIGGIIAIIILIQYQ